MIFDEFYASRRWSNDLTEDTNIDYGANKRGYVFDQDVAIEYTGNPRRLYRAVWLDEVMTTNEVDIAARFLFNRIQEQELFK